MANSAGLSEIDSGTKMYMSLYPEASTDKVRAEIWPSTDADALRFIIASGCSPTLLSGRRSGGTLAPTQISFNNLCCHLQDTTVFADFCGKFVPGADAQIDARGL